MEKKDPYTNDIFKHIFSALCKYPVVYGEDNRSKQEMDVSAPPQAFSNTLHPPGPDTSSLWLSHPNEHWGRRDAEAHTHTWHKTAQIDWA